MKHFLWIFWLSLTLVGCNEAEQGEVTETTVTEAQANPVATKNALALDVYKSETCGCCGAWIEYMDQQGYELTSHHPDDLGAKKQALGVAPRYQSCHTAVTGDGYVFEGHIPAKVVQRFMEEKPEAAIGLAVPGMPLGSPGMEVEDRFSPYNVLLLKEDGSSEVYASFETAAEQH